MPQLFQVLRVMLDDAGFESTRIVAADGTWDIVNEVTQDAELDSALDVVG